MTVCMLLLRHRLVEYWEGLRCHRPSALEFDTSEKPRRVKLGVVRAPKDASQVCGDHSAIVIITIKIEGSNMLKFDDNGTSP